MIKEEIIEKYDLEDGVIFFEPCETFDNGILGVTEDRKHIVYGYNNLVCALANDFEREWVSHEYEGEKPDFYSDACEWVDYNTIRSLSYLDSEYRPIIIYELVE